MAKTLQQLLTKISLRKLEEASVVFKETQEGSEYYEVLKTRDPMLTLGGQYSEDLVKYYVLMNEKVIVLGSGEDLTEEEQPLKVGDYAKVVDENHDDFGLIVKVTSTNYSDWHPYDTEYLNGKDADCHEEEYLVRATDEEVAEAKRQQAEKFEAERWAKIGRKPNEFKKGDIVRVIKVPGGVSNGHPAGVIGEVIADATPARVGKGNPSVKYNGGVLICNCELITPVDERFDRP